MTITLELPPVMSERLKEEAARREKPVEEYALSLLEHSMPPPAPMPKLKTGADVVAFWRANGLIGDWADREDIGDSLDYSRNLRRQAEIRSQD